MHGNDSSYAPTYMYIVPQHTMRLEDNPIMHVHCVRIFTRELVVRLSFWLDFSPLLREDARCFFYIGDLFPATACNHGCVVQNVWSICVKCVYMLQCL